ncbi:MAG TPA: class I SAM-dependent methyltransferase [Fimbriimonadaceae bacterium]|nr:class I SAM-dependent methyltransferase [Fimbriimonadaceae bacterium]
MRNVYEASDYAAGYAELGWDGTYQLVRRDLPSLLQRCVPRGRALDFGCGAGRSTRLLADLGYDAEGVDVATSMVERARTLNPDLTFRTIEHGDFSAYAPRSFDLVLACFPFDNIAGQDRKVALFSALRSLLRPAGILVNVVSSADIYIHEWVSFTTTAFPENRVAGNEDVVRIVTRTFKDAPVCEDIRCDDGGYEAIYAAAGLHVRERHRPLGRNDDGVAWISEREISPWVLWVLTASE